MPFSITETAKNDSFFQEAIVLEQLLELAVVALRQSVQHLVAQEQ